MDDQQPSPSPIAAREVLPCSRPITCEIPSPRPPITVATTAHKCGLFGRAAWLRLLHEVGFARHGAAGRALGPHPYLFWFFVGGPTIVEAAQLYPGWLAAVAFLVGYYFTLVGSNVGLALALHRWMGLLSQRVYRGVLVVAGVIPALYGLVLLGRAFQPWLAEPAQ
jgi:hypothetical protein